MIWMMAPHRASRACFTGWVDPTGPVAAGVEWEWGRGGGRVGVLPTRVNALTFCCCNPDSLSFKFSTIRQFLEEILGLFCMK